MLSWSNNLILIFNIFHSNDEKYDWSNSAGQGLSLVLLYYQFVFFI